MLVAVGTLRFAHPTVCYRSYFQIRISGPSSPNTGSLSGSFTFGIVSSDLR
jgi:hypothetical protein